LNNPIIEETDDWCLQCAVRSNPLNQRMALADSTHPERRKVVLLVKAPDSERALMIDALHENREGVMMKPVRWCRVSQDPWPSPQRWPCPADRQ
jgi:hypothetical protein